MNGQIQQGWRTMTSGLRRGVIMAAIALGLWITNISGAIAVDYTNAPLIGRDFSHQDLSSDNFVRCNLKEANLEGSNLQTVQLFSANLSDTNLRDADLRNAILDKAKIRRTDLRNALLEGASGINMNIVAEAPPNIEGADFTDALLDDRALRVLCAIATGTNPTTGRNTLDTLYCD